MIIRDFYAKPWGFFFEHAKEGAFCSKRKIGSSWTSFKRKRKQSLGTLLSISQRSSRRMNFHWDPRGSPSEFSLRSSKILWSVFNGILLLIQILASWRNPDCAFVLRAHTAKLGRFACSARVARTLIRYTDVIGILRRHKEQITQTLTACYPWPELCHLQRILQNWAAPHGLNGLGRSVTDHPVSVVLLPMLGKLTPC